MRSNRNRASMTSLEEKFTDLYNLLTKAPVPLVIDDLNRSPTNSQNQVRDSELEPGRSLRSDANRDRPRLIDNRDSLIRRIELPFFNGEDVYGRIALAERYFWIGGYSEATKLELVSVSLSGDLLSWFNSEILRQQFVNWMNFKNRLIAGFSEVKLRHPSQLFFNVQQKGKNSEYIHKFEDLLTHVSGLTDTQKERIFMNGLVLYKRTQVLCLALYKRRCNYVITRAWEDHLLYQDHTLVSILTTVGNRNKTHKRRFSKIKTSKRSNKLTEDQHYI